MIFLPGVVNSGRKFSLSLPKRIFTMKKALITGVTGQDGAYLAEFLLKRYEVHGLKRRTSLFNTDRIDHLYQDPHLDNRNFILHHGDMTDSSSLIQIIEKVQPDEIYNLAAQSHVAVSFEEPEYTANSDALGTLRLLEAIRILGLTKKTRFYQASTSELYGLVQEIPQTEKTPFYPRSPYAVAKLYSYWIVVNYREAYRMYACNGILFNHESPVRGETFVTRKITRALARIDLGLQELSLSRQPECQARLGPCPGLCRHAVADAAAGGARRLRHRLRASAFGTGICRTGGPGVGHCLALAGRRGGDDRNIDGIDSSAGTGPKRAGHRQGGSPLFPAHRGRNPAGRCLQGQKGTGLAAEDYLRRTGAGNGRQAIWMALNGTNSARTMASAPSTITNKPCRPHRTSDLCP